MAILDVDIQENIIDHHDFIVRLKDFCESKGWTIQDFQQNVSWNRGFIAGSEDYLQIESSGYGSQTLHFRFRMESSGNDPQHENLNCGAQKAGDTAVDTNSFTQPHLQNNWLSTVGRRNQISIKSTGFDRAWFFGDSSPATFVLVVMEFDATTCSFLTFGSLELSDTTQSEGNMLGSTTITSSAFEWYNRNMVNPFFNEGDWVLWDGERKNSAEHKVNIKINTGNNQSHSFFSMSDTIVRNSYSEIDRVVSQNVHYVRFNSDNKFRDIGLSPVHFVWHEGLTMGEIIKISNEEYYTFPFCRLNERFGGIAVRTA